MASNAATRIDIVANDKATEVFQRVGAEADKTASRLLGMGAATGRALKAAGLDVDTSGLGKFAQQSSYLLSQISTLRKQSTGAFTDISSGLRENIALLTQDTNAYIANTQAAIANKQARLELVTQGIADNARIIRELESDNQWRWKPEKRDLREELSRENVQLIGEQTTLTRALVVEQKKLDTVTAAGNTRLAALKGTFKGLKDAGANFINFLGGPWTLGVTAAVAVVGLLSRAESQAEKTAKEYGTTLDDIAKRYEALASGADEAADATLRASRSYQTAHSQWIAGVLDEIQTAQGKMKSLMSEALGSFGADNPAVEYMGTLVDAKVLRQLDDLNARLNSGKITAKEAFLEFSALRKEWEKTDIPSAFASVLDQVGVHLDFIARNADVARKALEDLGSVQPAIGNRLLEVASRVDDELLSAYQKTTQGQREALEERKRVAQGWERLYAGTNLEGTASAVVKDAEKALKDFDDRLNKPGKVSGGSSGTDKTASALRQVNDEIARLTMTAKEFEAYQFERKLADMAGKVPTEKIAELRKAFEGAHLKKTFDDASQGLQDFEREYQRAMGGAVDMTASITAEMDKFRAAAAVAYDAGVLGAAEYEEQLRRIDELQREKLQESSTRWQDGAIRGLKNYAKEARDEAKNAEGFVTSSFSGMEDALASFVTKGKVGVRSLADSIIADLARIAIRQSITGPLASGLMSALGGLFGGGGGSHFASGMGGVGSNLFAAGAGMARSAKGNVFNHAPALSAYSNSIVDQPTVFPFAKGGRFGLMGEAGPEAILPLRRGPGGELGVNASGAGGAAPIVNVNIHTPPGMKAETEKRPNASGGFDMTVFIEQVDNAMAAGIASGRSKTAQAIGKMGRMS